MKTLRTLLALAFATALAGSVAFADDHGKATEAKPEKAACGCVVKKDGKVCGVDSDCCCTGEKATGKKAEKKSEKKADEKKACCANDKCTGGECKADKDGKKADCADCAGCK
jgi:hypothetical protein